MPARTLADLRADPTHSMGTSELSIGYQRAVDCFENTAARISVDGENSTNITVLSELQAARVTVVSYGLVYVLLDIVGTSPSTSRVTGYAVEPFRTDAAAEWMRHLERCR